MRMRIRFLLLLVGLFLIPSTGWAQTGLQPVLFTGPVSNPRPEDGGVYVGIQYLYMNGNRTLQNQIIANRGFFDLVGDINPSGGPGWVGSHVVALETSQLMGPGQSQPGWDLFLGWKFQGGVVVELGAVITGTTPSMWSG